MKRIIVFGLGLLAVVFGLAHEGVIQRTNPPVNEKSELTKTFARINRAEDLAISEDGSFAWACTGLGEHGLYKFDLKTGEILKQYGPSYWFPQNLLAHKGKIYIVTEVQSEDRQNPNLLIVEEGSGKTIGKLALGDWRLYRTSSASLKPGWALALADFSPDYVVTIRDS